MQNYPEGKELNILQTEVADIFSWNTVAQLMER